MAKAQSLFVRPVQVKAPPVVKAPHIAIVTPQRENNFRKFAPLAPNKPK